jgi:hypothetical protein
MGIDKEIVKIIQESAIEELPIVSEKPEDEQGYRATLYQMLDSANFRALLKTKPEFGSEEESTRFMEDIVQQVRNSKVRILDDVFAKTRKRNAIKSEKRVS